MIIYFVRHGQSQSNILKMMANRAVNEYGLTDIGKKQICDTAEKLSRIRFDAIYSSDLLRARESAEIFAGKYNKKIVETKLLREFDVGVFDGKSGDESLEFEFEIMKKWMLDMEWDIGFDDGETFRMILGRFDKFVEMLKENHEDKSTILVVAHGGLFQCVVPYILREISYKKSLYNLMPNAGFIGAEIHEGKWSIIEKSFDFIESI